MKLLGIDYGRKKIGLAVSDGIIAEPWKVIRGKNAEDILIKVKNAVKLEFVESVVIGVSEGKTANETKTFGDKLRKELTIPIVYFDETLSTQLAKELSLDAKIKRKKRKEMEDAYSAAIILQSYIDNNL